MGGGGGGGAGGMGDTFDSHGHLRLPTLERANSAGSGSSSGGEGRAASAPQLAKASTAHSRWLQRGLTSKNLNSDATSEGKLAKGEKARVRPASTAARRSRVPSEGAAPAAAKAVAEGGTSTGMRRSSESGGPRRRARAASLPVLVVKQ